jgi:hypothetical protein
LDFQKLRILAQPMEISGGIEGGGMIQLCRLCFAKAVLRNGVVCENCVRSGPGAILVKTLGGKESDRTEPPPVSPIPSFTMELADLKAKPSHPIQQESVNPGIVHNGETGIHSGIRLCLNPFWRRPVETRPGALRDRTSCDDQCRSMLSALRRVACAFFPELEPAEAVERLLERVAVDVVKKTSND